MVQLRIRDTVKGSQIAVNLVRGIGKPIIGIFQPVLPGDPQIYFSSGLVS